MTNVFAFYLLAAVVFAVPAVAVGSVVYAVAVEVVALVRFIAGRFAAKATYEVATPVGGIVIPEGMNRDEFDAWWDANVAA